MTEAGARLIEAAKEAVAIAKGEQPASRIHHNGFAYVPEDRWQDISTAPELERVIVAGWQPATKRVEGYWWMHEDVIVNGKPDSFPDALLWHPFPTRPALSPPLPSTPNVG